MRGKRGGVERWSRALKLAVLVVLAAVTASRPSTADAATPWRIAPAPLWPITAKPASEAPPPLGNAIDASGQHLMLFAHELRVAGRRESFWHTTRRITSESGLQASSQLNVEFDPSYETLVLHYAAVQRGSTRINQLERGRVRLVQREVDLESQIFDARESAVIFLEDLRVGDVVDVAYTIEGADPTLEGTVDDTFLLGLTVPTDRFIVRLVTDRDRDLNVSLRGPSSVTDLEEQFRPRADPAKHEYLWDLAATNAQTLESEAPKWFDPLPLATVSGFKSWRDVAAWGLRLFEPSPPLGPSAREWVERERQGKKPEDYALRATRFVQDEIRYLGIEEGVARRRASDPNTTFQRRYGDCKGKTALLVALLRAAGLAADPVLVSSTRGIRLAGYPPNAGAFDHAIVRLSLANEQYFIDPTVSLQGGGIDRFRYCRFGAVLVLASATTTLQITQPELPQEPELVVSDWLHLSLPSATAEAKLEMERTYTNELADQMRAVLRSLSPEQRTKTYLSVYQPDYPDIHELSPIEQADDRTRNVLRIAARYGVPNVWRWRESEKRYAATISARALQSFLPTPNSSVRTQPLVTAFPATARQTIRVDLPFDLPQLSSTPETLETKASSFAFHSSYAARRLTYEYELAARARAVDPHEMQQQATFADQVSHGLQRTILYRAGDASAGSDGINWLLLALSFVVLCGAVAFSWWAYGFKTSIANTRLRHGPAAAYGGWLWLLGLNLLSLPPALAWACFTTLKPIASASGWLTLTTPDGFGYRPGLAALLVVGSLLRVWALPYSVTVLVTFVKKRRSFPWHLAVLTIWLVLLHAGEGIVLSFVSTKSPSEYLMPLIRSGLFCLFWNAYLWRSRHVSWIFVNGPKKRRRKRREIEAPAAPQLE